MLNLAINKANLSINANQESKMSAQGKCSYISSYKDLYNQNAQVIYKCGYLCGFSRWVPYHLWKKHQI